jgi:hypothetical protein
MAEETPAPAATARNRWDFLIVVAVVAFLGGVTIFLVDRYGTDADKVGAILGILVPAIGAIFGVSIGFQAGTTKGEEKGKSDAKQEIKKALAPRVKQLEQAIGNIAGRIERDGASDAGAESFSVEGVQFDGSELKEVREQVAETKGYVQGL